MSNNFLHSFRITDLTLLPSRFAFTLSFPPPNFPLTHAMFHFSSLSSSFFLPFSLILLPSCFSKNKSLEKVSNLSILKLRTCRICCLVNMFGRIKKRIKKERKNPLNVAVNSNILKYEICHINCKSFNI